MSMAIQISGRAPLPPSWTLLSLGGLGAWCGGGTPSKTEGAFWTEGTIPWVSPKDMKCESIHHTEDYITLDAVRQSSANLLPSGSVLLVVRSGILRHSLPVAVTDAPVSINQDIKALWPHAGVNPSFVAWALRRFEREILQSCSKNGTTVQSIEYQRLLRFEVPLAPLCEQKRIVAEIEKQLSRLDAATTALKRAQANLRRYRASVLKAACEGRLVSSGANGERDAGAPSGIASSDPQLGNRIVSADVDMAQRQAHALPPGWVWNNLADILNEPLANGKSFPNATDGFPVLRLTALKGGRLDLREYKRAACDISQVASLLVRPGDFLVARGNGTLSLVGRGGLAEECQRPIAFPDTMIRVRTNPSVCTPRYLALVWDSPVLRQQVEKAAHTTAGIHKISQRQLAEFVLPIPPMAQQLRIVEEVERRLSVVDMMTVATHTGITRADRLRQAILKRAFEGRLVPQDPDDEPASVLLDRIRRERDSACSEARLPRKKPNRLVQ